MKKIRLKSGGHANLLEGDERPIEGEINFFSQKELDTAMKLGNQVHDPEAKKEFWKTLLEKKAADPNYSLLKDFPEVVLRREFPGREICESTIQMLRGKNVNNARS